MGASRTLCVPQANLPDRLIHLSFSWYQQMQREVLEEAGLWFLQGKGARLDGDGKQYVLNVGTQAGT